MSVCPRCGFKTITAEIAIKYDTCPKCGYTETKIAGKVEAPSPLNGLIALAGIIGLVAIAAGISMLCSLILKGSLEGDIIDKARKKQCKRRKITY